MTTTLTTSPVPSAAAAVTTTATTAARTSPERLCWRDGSMMPEAQATVSIFDRGLLFGDGVYEVAAVFNGRLLDADLHLARLDRSLAALQLVNPHTRAEWVETLQRLADANGVQEGLVYLQVTRGVAEREFAFPADASPGAFAYARHKALRTDAAAKGIALHPVADLRWARRDIKSIALLAQVLAKQEARAAGAYEALLHEDGMVTEGGSSNAWIVNDGAIVTRPLSSRILAGITRDVVLEIASAKQIPVVQRAFTLSELDAASECFITSATTFVLPVLTVGGTTIGDGRPGPIAVALREAYLARADALTR